MKIYGAQVISVIVSVQDRATGEDVHHEQQHAVGTVMGIDRTETPQGNGSPGQAKGRNEGVILCQFSTFRHVQSSRTTQ